MVTILPDIYNCCTLLLQNMATSAVYQNLNEFVTCPVCLELFEGRNPRSLPCLHSFCSDCIQGVLNAARSAKSTDDILCPICQKLATVPGGSVSKLPAYFISQQIQTIMEQLMKKYSKCKICKTPQHSEVASYCFQCTMAVCTTCKSKHDRRHKNHAQVRVSSSTIAYVVCPEHDQHVEAFCIECSRAVCGACAIDTHYDHTINDLCSNEDKEYGINQVFANHIDSADKQLAKLKIIQDDFNKHFDTAEHQLDRHHNNAIKRFNKQHKSFRAEIQQRRNEVNQNLDKSKALLQQGKDCVEKLKRQSACWRRPIPAIPEASLTDTQDLIEAIKQQIPSTNVRIDEPRRLVFVPSGHVSLGDMGEKVINLTMTSHPQRVTRDVNTNQDKHDGTKPKTKHPVFKKIKPETTGNLKT